MPITKLEVGSERNFSGLDSLLQPESDHISYESIQDQYFEDFFALRMQKFHNSSQIQSMNATVGFKGKYELNYIIEKESSEPAYLLNDGHTAQLHWSEDIDFSEFWLNKFNDVISGPTPQNNQKMIKKLMDYFFVLFDDKLIDSIRDQTNLASEYLLSY